MNSRKAMLRPTITTRVMPVAGCCSTFARDIVAFLSSFLWPELSSGDGCSRKHRGLFVCGHEFRFQLFANLIDHALECDFKGVAIAIGGAADPQQSLSFIVHDRHDPEARVDH